MLAQKDRRGAGDSLLLALHLTRFTLPLAGTQHPRNRFLRSRLPHPVAPASASCPETLARRLHPVAPASASCPETLTRRLRLVAPASASCPETPTSRLH